MSTPFVPRSTTWVQHHLLPALDTILRHNAGYNTQPATFAALVALGLLADARHLDGGPVLDWISRQRRRGTFNAGQLTNLAWRAGCSVWSWEQPVDVPSLNVSRIGRWAKSQVYAAVKEYYRDSGVVIDDELPTQLASVLVPFLLADPADDNAGQVLDAIVAARQRSAKQHRSAIEGLPAPSIEVFQPAIPTQADIARLKVEQPALDQAVESAEVAIASLV